MNIINVIEEIEKVDNDVSERLSPRRKAIKNFLNIGSKIALSAVPLALGGLFKKAYGQQLPDKILEVLNFALTLEHLEHRFYQTAINTPKLIPSGKDNIIVIRDHERSHVKFLQNTITSSGGTPVAEAKYDFTGKGMFPNVFSDYKEFLTVAQAFEDTGVSAYKGRAGDLMKSNAILKAALQIHSTEARHAAHIRFARRLAGYDPVIKPWIVGNDNTSGTPLGPIYKEEDDNTQALIKLTNINGFDLGHGDTASFDEPLEKGEVMKIVAPFFAS
ncbi:MAG TPA: ferritin-like domain-containing protein [Sphingobacteriaceae bacterium]|nr:ferritin-like domain-containing protein [Sphingobacteriaceae bacterium]